MLRTSSDQMKT